MSTEPCPQCGKPIADTAYVCADCQRELASKLNRAAGLWDDVQDTVGHLANVEGGSPVSRPARPDWSGPLCKGRACDHESCTAIWKSSTRLRKIETAGVREDKGLLDLDALENSWVVANTVDAWGSHVADMRGNRRMPVIGGQTLHVIPNDRPERCVYSDLPIGQCACGHNGHKAAS